MMYPTNEEMPEQVPEPALVEAVATMPTVPLRIRVREWLRTRVRRLLGIEDRLDSMEKAFVDVVAIITEQNTAHRNMLERFKLNESVISHHVRILEFHTEVLKRWAAGSEILRRLEEDHAKKLRRQDEQQARHLTLTPEGELAIKASATARGPERIEDEDGG